MASESMSDDMSEVGGENEGVPVSSASSISNDVTSEPATIMSETEDSNSYVEPSSSETDSCLGTGSRMKDDASCKSSSSDLTVASSSREQGEDGSSGQSVKFPVRPGIVWRKGERLEAQDYQSNWYTSKIMSIDAENKCVLIHFEGWNQRYDELMDMDSDRLRPLTRHSERRDKRRKGKTIFRVGDQVQAKWTDCKMYLAKIDEVLDDGSYMVLFYDGFRKNIQPINLRPVPVDQKQKFHVKPLVLSPKELKNMKSKPIDFKGKTGTPASGPSTSSASVEKTKGVKLSGPAAGSQKKTKLIVSGSLFSKKVKVDKPAEEGEGTVVKRRSKDGGTKVKAKPRAEKEEKEEVQVKEGEAMKTEEVKQAAEDVEVIAEGQGGGGGGEEVTEKEKTVASAVAAVAGTEAGCQTYVATAAVPRKIGRKRPRTSTFPGERRKRRKPSKGAKAGVVGRIVKKAKSLEVDKPLESPGLPPAATTTAAATLVPPAPVTAAVHVPSKAFLVEEDHNSFKCEECGKGFRKHQLLADHLKHYHKPEGPPQTPAPSSRKRKTTLSTCSTDSDMSVSSKSNSTKRRRHISEISVGSPDVVMKMSFDEDAGGGGGGGGSSSAFVEGGVDSPVVVVGGEGGEEEASDEVVHCICGLQEETGTMIQCDCCQCWQHTQCCGVGDEELDSDKTYICSVCKNPPGVRESDRYLYDMDWFRKGQLPRFSFSQWERGGREGEREKERVGTHHLMAQLLAVNRVMHGLREEIAVTREKEHPELRLWHPEPPKESRSVGVSTADAMDPAPSVHMDPPPGPPHPHPPPAAREGSPGDQGACGPVREVSFVAAAPGLEVPTPTTSTSTEPASEKTLKAASASDKEPSAPLTSGLETGKRTAEQLPSGDPIAADSLPSVKGEVGLTAKAGCEGGVEAGGGVVGKGVADSATGASGVTEKDSTNAGRESGSEGREGSQQLNISEGNVDGTDPAPGGVKREVDADAKVKDTAPVNPEGKMGAEKDAAGSVAKGEGVMKVKGEPGDEVKTELLDTSGEQEEAVTTVYHDPFADCKLSLLNYVRGIHDDLSHQLDDLELQIAAAERQEFGAEAAGCYSNIPALKHSLYRLARDLNKVKGIASYR
ncbi:PHD finger protein 20-like isoform X2 [Babylonia areolata]|uniref:PHD finger protein 20-like isoform X2 n=1 Tax=Babylonia areolata TaxID=304850 RepID=UPI003FD622E9